MSKQDLVPKACYVVYPGEKCYPIADDVEALPIRAIDQIWD